MCHIVFGSPNVNGSRVKSAARPLEPCEIGTISRGQGFEGKSAQRVGAEYALATSSFTAVLRLAMVASGVGPRREVITTPTTFDATVNSIIHTGAIPIFANRERDEMNIDPFGLEGAITPRARAISPHKQSWTSRGGRDYSGVPRASETMHIGDRTKLNGSKQSLVPSSSRNERV